MLGLLKDEVRRVKSKYFKSTESILGELLEKIEELEQHVHQQDIAALSLRNRAGVLVQEASLLESDAQHATDVANRFKELVK